MFAILDDKGHLHQRIRINHTPGAIKDYLSQFPEGTPVALESVGNWYWIVSKEQLCRDRGIRLCSKDGSCSKDYELALGEVEGL